MQWPAALSLSIALHVSPYHALPQAIFGAASADAVDLIRRMLTYPPNSRGSATDALAHSYFALEPAPTLPSLLPKSAKESPKRQRGDGDDSPTAKVQPAHNRRRISKLSPRSVLLAQLQAVDLTSF
eukprot:TRINITY_DN5298_c0_g1_i3.p3 TRINITY_DN5298_c0_g1~~TRINITY_DN5298_c0_g1_i3.p3  ORF type:complete len:126 (-),score=25.02 TRINITY_DN5298_c0_g1_i3:71-448(-)